MKRITDPTFKYTPSFATDLKARFRRMELQRKANEKEAAAKVEHLPAKKRA